MGGDEISHDCQSQSSACRFAVPPEAIEGVLGFASLDIPTAGVTHRELKPPSRLRTETDTRPPLGVWRSALLDAGSR